jgi:sugar lactone lactonase YvrE
MVKVTMISDEAAELGEGPRLDGRTGEVVWVDILAGRLYRCAWDGGRLRTIAVIEVGRHLGAVAPVDAPGGGWVAAAGQGFAHVAEDGTVTVLAEPEAHQHGRTRMNDGACDPQGRFWAGSMAYDERPGAGTLYRMDHDGTVTAMVHGVTISNGLGWSPDGTTMYYADSGAGTVDAFDFDGVGGDLERRRTLVRCDGPAVPDGLWVDDEGCLWVAMWGGGEVRRYAPDGGLVHASPLPVSRPTACCFVGQDRDTLIITSARSGLSAEALAREPAAGRVMAIDAGATGPAATPYRPHAGVLA